MQCYHVVAACAGYTRNAVTSKALTLISGAPDTRAQYSLLNCESGKGRKRKAVSEFCYLGDMLSAGGCCELAAVTPCKINVIKASSATCPSPSHQSQSAPCGQR